jgi:hypothetical protein
MNDKTAAFLCAMRSTLDKIERGELEASSYTAMAEAARQGNNCYPTGRYTFTLEVTDPKRLANHETIGGEIIKP